MIKKIGVVTWNGSFNYGTNLQAYALCKYLESEGHHIDFVVPSIPDVAKQGLFVNLKFFILKLMSYAGLKKNYRLPQYIRIRDFLKKEFYYVDWYKLSQQEKLSYDLIFTGSDQIWNPNVLQTFYLLDFVPDSIKKYSYASSLGVTTLEEKTITLYRKYLSRFSKLSVREQQGVDLLRKFLNKDVLRVPDPTFLLTKEQWGNIAKPVKIDKPYILCYFIGDNVENWNSSISISQKRNIPIVAIRALEAKYIPDNIKKVEGIGPLEFLYLIKNASLICTDSFHGMVFSLIFNKEFLSYLRFAENDMNSQNSRIHELLDNYGLNNHFAGASMEKLSDIEWQTVNSKILKERNIGINYINNVLNEAL